MAAPGDPGAQGEPAGLPLLQAVADHDLAALQAALEQPDAPLQHGGITALHVAALVEFPEAVQPLLDAGVNINAVMPISYKPTAEVLPAGLEFGGAALPARWVFSSDTALSAALFMGSLRTAEALLAAGARQAVAVGLAGQGSAWRSLERVLAAHPNEEGSERVDAAAEVLLSHGLPGEAQAVWEAHDVAAQLAWPERKRDPEELAVMYRLLQVHRQAPPAGEGGGGLGAAGEALATGALHMLGRALGWLDLPSFLAWLRVPALRALPAGRLLEFVHDISERMLYWQRGLPAETAARAMLALLDWENGAPVRQAIAQEAAAAAERPRVFNRWSQGERALANAACAGFAAVVERLLAAGVSVSSKALERASPEEVRQMRVNIEESGDWDHIWRTGLYCDPEEMLHQELGQNMLRAAQAQAWSPAIHRWWPPHFRAAARALLLAAHRGAKAAAAAAARPALGASGALLTRRQAQRAASASPMLLLLGGLQPELLQAIVAQAAFPLSAWDWHSYGLAGDFFVSAPFAGWE